jgi:hypothetical protein
MNITPPTAAGVNEATKSLREAAARIARSLARSAEPRPSPPVTSRPRSTPRLATTRRTATAGRGPACRVLQITEKVVIVTARQFTEDTAQVPYAKADGYRVVAVPDDMARSLGSLTDLDGRPMVDLTGWPRFSMPSRR